MTIAYDAELGYDTITYLDSDGNPIETEQLNRDTISQLSLKEEQEFIQQKLHEYNN